MTRVVAIVLTVGWWSIAIGATPEPPVVADRFRPVDVYVDTGNAPLAAYQIEVTVGDGPRAAKIVGVEGGAEPFRTAPYYDPAALQQGRIVIAAFTTAADAPPGRIHVATLHLFEPAGYVPAYGARIVVAVAVDDGGVRDVSATVTLEPKGPVA